MGQGENGRDFVSNRSFRTFTKPNSLPSLQEVKGHCSQPPSLARGRDGKVYWTATMAFKGDDGGVGVLVMRADKVIDLRSAWLSELVQG